MDIDFSTLPPAVAAYRPRCPGCTPESLSAEGARPCSHYDCSGLPAELEVSCNTCMYDFVAEDGQTKCDHQTCETALRLKDNVQNYKAWVHLIATEASR